MACAPAASDVVEYFAVCETSTTVALATPSTLKTTLPAGMAVPVFAVTEAVNVTWAPGAAGLGLAASVVVVGVEDERTPRLSLATNALVPPFTSPRFFFWNAPVDTGKSVENDSPVM